jgi:hypothetical protein
LDFYESTIQENDLPAFKITNGLNLEILTITSHLLDEALDPLSGVSICIKNCPLILVLIDPSEEPHYKNR